MYLKNVKRVLRYGAVIIAKKMGGTRIVRNVWNNNKQSGVTLWNDKTIFKITKKLRIFHDDRTTVIKKWNVI